ncbi:MAG: phage tail tape measure protein, partial [Prevotella sp.]|nr:phage tail tape measure protein [Prevotella sp.]
MALRIDRVQLQFEIQPDYEQQELRRLEEDLKKANRALSQTEREIERVRKAKPSDPAQYAQWQKNLDALNAKYKEQVAAVQGAQRAIDKHTQQMGLQNLSLAQLTKRAQTLNTILRNLNPNSEAYQRYNQQLQRINARIKELRGEATKTKLSLASMADGMNKYFLLVSSAVGSLTGLALTIRKCTDAYAQMEDVMASVRKYTGQTDEEVRQMNEDFKQLDTRSSREQLNELAGAAGRLGLTAKKDIMEFVDGADKIGVALGDDLGEGAVDTIGKLAIAFGENDRLGLRGAMLATGSALNEIVQNSPAQAQPVIEFTERLSGVGQQAHMTQAQIMGFAAALDQNNQEMATSATVMSQLITKMYKDPARFAQMANMEVTKLTDLMRNDMNAALVEWLQNVNKLGDMSVLAGKFDELKMDGTRAVGVLSTLAGHVDQVVEAQRIATNAYAEGTSVIKEFEVQNTTVAAEIDKAKKRFADLSIELGGKLLPVARHAITAGSAGVRVLAGLTDTIGRYKGLIVTLTTAYVAYNTVLGIAWRWKQRVIAQLKVMYALEALQKTLTNARTVATAAYNVVMGALTGNTQRMTVAQTQLNAAMSANVIGAVVAAAVVLVAVLKNAYDEVTKLDAATQAMNDVALETKSRTIDERTEMDMLVETVKNANVSEEKRREALEKLNGKLMEQHLGNLTEEDIR